MVGNLVARAAARCRAEAGDLCGYAPERGRRPDLAADSAIARWVLRAARVGQVRLSSVPGWRPGRADQRLCCFAASPAQAGRIRCSVGRSVEHDSSAAAWLRLGSLAATQSARCSPISAVSAVSAPDMEARTLPVAGSWASRPSRCPARHPRRQGALGPDPLRAGEDSYG